jgi:hypothetical protein
VVSITDEIIEELLLIRKGIEELSFLILYRDRDKIIESAIAVFGTSSHRADVYLSLDGKKNCYRNCQGS